MPEWLRVRKKSKTLLNRKYLRKSKFYLARLWSGTE
ncbi:hypothetical protein [Cesiribacter sp. SM1]